MIARRKTPRPKAIWVLTRDRLAAESGESSVNSHGNNSAVAAKSYFGVRRKFTSKPTSKNFHAKAQRKKSGCATKRLRTVSKSHSRVLQVYYFLKGFFVEAKVTGFAVSRSDSKNMDVHHLRGKVSTLLWDVRFWKLTDRSTHIWIENNKDAARAQGLLCQKGDWLKIPDDEITHELKITMQCLKNGTVTVRQAKESLVSLIVSRRLLAG